MCRTPCLTRAVFFCVYLNTITKQVGSGGGGGTVSTTQYGEMEVESN